MNELNNEGDFWRILRRSTFVDLIKFNFVKFQKEHTDEELIEMINLFLKIKILTRFKEIKLSKTPDETFSHFNRENDLIVKLYNDILTQIIRDENRYINTDLYDLNNEVQYLKVLKELEIADYSDEIFDKIIFSSLNTLRS